jgi:hypothetical protein
MSHLNLLPKAPKYIEPTIVKGCQQKNPRGLSQIFCTAKICPIRKGMARQRTVMGREISY